MPPKKEIDRFIKSQQSIHLYEPVRRALRDVLSHMSTAEYKKATDGLVLMVLHERAIAQVMHFKAKDKVHVLQLTIPRKVPSQVLKYVIAHELGHVVQGRNWRKSDCMELENAAEAYAQQLGFPRTKAISAWITRYRENNL